MPLLDFFTNDSLFADFDRLLDNAFSRGTWQIGGPRWHTQFLEDDAPEGLCPRIDVREDKEKNVVNTTFELPGVNKDSVSVDVLNNLLAVSGESKSEAEGNGNGRRFGRFSRTFPVSEGVNPQEIKATKENDVLTVTYPRQILEHISKKTAVS
ncbi:hypothetical protein V8D89_004894 [Ganoderma adspersum]